jgi:coenzyme F420 hydrogenase subunit beta
MSKTPRVPSVGGDPRELPGEVREPTDKIWFRNLDEAVIEADRCIQCGSCVAACPSDSIGIDSDTGHPTLIRMCTGCSSCWDYCPRSGLRYERISQLDDLGADAIEPREYAARARTDAVREEGQDGGVVTTLLAELIESGEIDGAIVATRDPAEQLRGEATLATSREELLDSAGSIYNQVMSLGRVEDLIEEADLTDPDLALVATPCVIQGARALDLYDHDAAAPISLTVALMCTRSFEHRRLVGILREHDVPVDDIDHLDVADGTLRAYDADGNRLASEDVKTFDEAGLRGCDECTDFVGGAADISAGNVGSEDGYTTVIVRTETGQQAWNAASDGLETTDLANADALESIASWNERRGKHYLQREHDPYGSIGVSYTEHRRAYDGTDREPKSLNPARVHQYEEWC